VSDLVTLNQQNPDFAKYLWGTFSKDKRALPLRSLNVRTDQETVTFRVVPVKELKNPSWPVVWLKALRPRAFLQVLVPMALILIRAMGSEMGIDPDLPWLTTLGVVFLFAAVLLRTDVQDHLSGVDRVRSDRGSRAIQNGWLTADTLNTASAIFLLLSILVSAPVLFVIPEIIVILIFTALLGIVAFFRRSGTYKDLPGGTWLLFFLGGPLLAVGFEMAVTGGITNWGLALGLLWGWLSLFPSHLRDLKNLIAEGQAGRGSLVGRAGFDNALVWIQAWWVLGVAGFVGFHFYFGAPFWFWILCFCVVAASMRFSLRLKKLKSPAGSEVARLRHHGETLLWLLVLLWAMGSFWAMEI
jgi:1,4-dihydroxy-2-naphthoate octaprenyltransferase